MSCHDNQFPRQRCVRGWHHFKMLHAHGNGKVARTGLIRPSMNRKISKLSETTIIFWMSAFCVTCESGLFSLISLLDVKILVVSESLPEPQSMSIEWFCAQLSEVVEVADVDIVLISDGRAFYFADLLVNCEDFHGVVLCTHAVYRIGRMFIREINTLLRGNATPLPENLSIVPLRFLEQFAFGEIAVVPYPNGCGLGNSNWLITKGVDPELVTFGAFVVTGFCAEPVLFPRPMIPQIQPKVVCVLPSAVQDVDYRQIIEDLVRRIEGCNQARKRVIIPTFIDDVLYSIMFFMRIRSSLNTDFYIVSYYFNSLTDILSSMPNEWEYAPIQNLSIVDLNKSDFPTGQGIFFAPYPVGQPEFGQVIGLKQRNFVRGSSVIQLYGEGSLRFGHNTSSMSLVRFVDNLKAEVVFGPKNLHIDYWKEYPGTYAVSDSFVRWIDMNQEKVKPYLGKIGQLPIIAGYLEGDRAIPLPLFGQYVLNAPDMEEVAMQLREHGATSINRDGNTITARFGFVQGDNTASITFGDTITIEAGRPTIEAIVQKCIGIEY